MSAPPPALSPSLLARRASPTMVTLTFVWVGVCLVLLVIGCMALGRKANRRAAELIAQRAQLGQPEQNAARRRPDETEREMLAAEEKHRARLQDPDFLNGNLARQNREREWQRRLAHDPELAKSRLEATLLRMEKLGGDPALASQAALEQVATLAAPPRSRVEVIPLGTGFEVHVAFRMAALSGQELGAVTKHKSTTTMRQEIQELSGRVIKDLFDSCGTRKIEKLTVSCNHALWRAYIPPNATASEREELLHQNPPIMGRLYRVAFDQAAARKINRWRSASLSQIMGLMQVEHDGLVTLTISGQAGSLQQDPESPLEF